jgi:hypothetical protein
MFKMTLPCDKDGRRKMRGLAAIQCSHEADFRVLGLIVWRISAPRPMSKKLRATLTELNPLKK